MSCSLCNIPWFRRSVLVALAPLLALLAGCGPDVESLSGTWEGRTADTAYFFDLQPSGEGRVRIATNSRTLEHACTWSVRSDRLWLVPASGLPANFRIIDHADDELVVRVANGLGGQCRLRRVGLR